MCNGMMLRTHAMGRWSYCVTLHVVVRKQGGHATMSAAHQHYRQTRAQKRG